MIPFPFVSVSNVSFLLFSAQFSNQRFCLEVTLLRQREEKKLNHIWRLVSDLNWDQADGNELSSHTKKMLNKFRKLKGYLVSNTTPIPKEETKKEAVNQEYSISEYPKPMQDHSSENPEHHQKKIQKNLPGTWEKCKI